MGESIMAGGVPLFACFAVLVTLINALTPGNNNQGSPIKPLYEKDEFLAGEETPVWFANVYYDNQHRPKYSFRRLNVDETPMVKASLDYWKDVKETGGFPIRRARSINNRENLTDTEQFRNELRNVKINRFDSPSPVEKRSTNGDKVVYPSILVVMDYDDVPLLVDGLLESRWSADQLVVYALAFWGTVNSSLRKIQNPRVSLRIAGIVITTSNQHCPYVSVYYNAEETFRQSVTPMIDYWRLVAKEDNSKFPIGSYDIVVHMTDTCPLGPSTECMALGAQHHPSLSAASKGPPCALTDQIGGVIIYDDKAFNGLQRAIVQTSKVLGGSGETPQYSERPRVTWNQKMVDTLSNALKDTSCMSAPKQYYQPGTPVPPILAGEFMPNGKQCEAAGYAADAWTCWDTSFTSGLSNCERLKCSNQHVWGITCREVGPTLDGSFCNAENTKICLDGQCVDKKRATLY